MSAWPHFLAGIAHGRDCPAEPVRVAAGSAAVVREEVA
jgi:hypothetical protein